MRNSTAPKFLKDVRLEVANPEQDVMRVRAACMPAVPCLPCAQPLLSQCLAVHTSRGLVLLHHRLQIELLQCGPRGDLVVGSGELHVSSMYNKGTLVHWFELISMDDEVTAELCLVMRYLQGEGLRGGEGERGCRRVGRWGGRG